MVLSNLTGKALQFQNLLGCIVSKVAFVFLKSGVESSIATAADAIAEYLIRKGNSI